MRLWSLAMVSGMLLGVLACNSGSSSPSPGPIAANPRAQVPASGAAPGTGTAAPGISQGVAPGTVQTGVSPNIPLPQGQTMQPQQQVATGAAPSKATFEAAVGRVCSGCHGDYESMKYTTVQGSVSSGSMPRQGGPGLSAADRATILGYAGGA